MAARWQEEHETEREDGHFCVLAGRIREREDGTYGASLVLDRCFMKDGDSAEKVPARVLCYSRVPEDAVPGRLVKITGKPEPCARPSNPGEYDDRAACFSDGIGFRFNGRQAECTGGRRSLPAYLTGRLRKILGERLENTAEPEDAGLYKAILLGDRSGLDRDLYEQYRRNGISHLLAISGLHMSVIGAGFYALLRKAGLGFGPAGAAAGCFLLGYGGLVGFSPSVFRSVFMLLLAFAASWLGRTYDILSALCAAALLLLLDEPYRITQAGFQLSFLAVGGIVCLGQPMIRDWGVRGPAQAFLVSLSVQAATLPSVLYFSFEFPVYGIFLNLLVIPPMTLVLYSGLGTLAASFFSGKAAAFFLGGGHVILRLYEVLCRMVQKLPGAVWCTGRPSAWQMALYCMCIPAGFFCFRGNRKNRASAGRKLAAGAAFWILGTAFLAPVRPSGLSVTFLDVGQGDGIFLQTGEGTLLVDCGSSQEEDMGQYTLVPFLKSQGIRVLDGAAVTHADSDHVSGIRYLLENPDCGIRIARLFMPEAGKGEKEYETLAQAASATGAAVEYLSAGDEISCLGKETQWISVRCLYPYPDSVCPDRNSQSLVLLVSCGEFRLLLTGDMEESGERELLKKGDLVPVTVLKVAHHGSVTSSGKEFLETVRPRYAVLSYGKGNPYGHPSEQVTDRLKEAGVFLKETARCGAVMLWTDGKKMRLGGFSETEEPY